MDYLTSNTVQKFLGIHLLNIHPIPNQTYHLILKVTHLLETLRDNKCYLTPHLHNSSMKSFLKKKGIDESRMISLGIFDYLIPDFDEKKTIPIKERKNSVIIAGNLSREK